LPKNKFSLFFFFLDTQNDFKAKLFILNAYFKINKKESGLIPDSG